MIKKLFTGQINSITIAAFLIAMSSLVSRLLGVFRDRILAGQFGASETLDMYYAAFRIPDFLYNLIVLGALSAGFVPILTQIIKDYKCKDPSGTNKDAWGLSNNILNIMGFLMLALSGLGIIFAVPLTKLITPGFSLADQITTANLTRIMFLSPFFLGISCIFGGILQSFKRFFVYSLSPIFYNVGIIIGALFFIKFWGIYGLALGVALGAFLHMLIQIPTVLKLGYRYHLSFNLKDPNTLKIGIMTVPRILSLAAVQINLLVITIIASTLPGGSISILNLASNLESFPVGIFGLSFAVAAFPVFSAFAFDKKKLIENFSSVFRQILFFVIPSTVLLLTLRAQIIRVILGSGKFDWNDTVLTINTLGFLSLSLFAQATIVLLVRVFYARHNSATPFYIGIFCVITNIILALNFKDSLGVAGLALADSISNILNFTILWVVLKTELGDMDEAHILTSVIKFSAAALACGITIQGTKLLVWPLIDMTKVWGVMIQGLTAGIAGILVYIAFCSLLRSEELFDFWTSIKRRLNWKKTEAVDEGEVRGI